MHRVKQFVAAPLSDKVRLVSVSVLLLTLHIALVVFSLSEVRAVLVRGSDFAADGLPGDPTPSRLARTVDVADHHLPGDRTCLVRSVTAETLLRLYGHRPEHRIGVMKDEDGGGGIRAHSWIELDGEILIGELEDLSEYSRLPSLDHGGEL